MRAISFVRLSRRAAVLMLLLFMATVTYAQITPSGDSYTNSAAPTTNYGVKTLLDVESSQTTYIQFNLSSIPSGYTGSDITQATLKLYVNAVTKAGSFNVDYVNGTWSEGTITYDNAPALGTTIAASVPLVTADKNQYILINVTSAVQAWLNGTEPNDGIALVANSTFNASFDSKENTTTSHPAELDLVFVGGGTITGVNTASGSGLTGGGTSGTLNLSLTDACAANQVLQWSGTAWVCAAVGTGTITGVTAGTDLTGGGTSGNVTLNLDTTKVPLLAANNTFTGTQTINNNMTITGSGSGTTLSVSGTGTYAMVGTINNSSTYSYGLAGSSNSDTGGGILGQSVSGGGVGVVGTATTGAGVVGLATTGIGVKGAANGTGSTGVYASGTGSGGTGVLASGSSYGVYGTSSTSIGVYGGATDASAENYGVYGTSASSDGEGVYGNGGAYGVMGIGGDYGVYGSGSYSGVIGEGNDMAVYALGNLGAEGTKSAVVALPNDHVVSLYAVESPENWFEDFGSGELKDGVATITLDATFAQTVSPEMGYHVFVTPNGDCEGLYVGQKTATGFEVRELHAGKSSVAFDYRIVAKRRGLESLRLEDVQADRETAEAIRQFIATRPSHAPRLKLPKSPERAALPEPPKVGPPTLWQQPPVPAPPRTKPPVLPQHVAIPESPK